MLPNLEIAVLHESIDWARIKGHTVALISFESIMRIKTFLRHPRFSSDTTGMALWKSAFSQWKCSCVDSRARKVRGGGGGGRR